MKMIFRSSLLILFWFWLSPIETEATDPDVCPEVVDNENIDEEDVSCFIYPTNILNCSWSLHTLQEDTQLSVYISTCRGDIIVHPPSLLSEGRVGSGSMVLRDYKDELFVILQFITSSSSVHNKIIYSCEYESAMIEVLFPPPNISASVKDGDLLVTWSVPHRQTISNQLCFEYQLDMGDQERPIHMMGQLSYTMKAQSTRIYRVRIRTKITNTCYGPPDWSDWSDVVKVEPSVPKPPGCAVAVMASEILLLPLCITANLLTGV